MATHGGWAIVTNRWIPGVPFDPFSYAAGITLVPVARFLAFTALGLAPAALATAYLGAHIADDVPTGYWVSGLVLAVAIWLAWRVARQTRQRAIVRTSA